MIEHLFMLRCLAYPQLPVWLIYQIMRHRTSQEVHPRMFAYVQEKIPLLLPSEAASLKDTPDVIQCDQCEGIFPMEFMHYLAWLDVDYCHACWMNHCFAFWDRETFLTAMTLLAHFNF